MNPVTLMPLIVAAVSQAAQAVLAARTAYLALQSEGVTEAAVSAAGRALAQATALAASLVSAVEVLRASGQDVPPSADVLAALIREVEALPDLPVAE